MAFQQSLHQPSAPAITRNVPVCENLLRVNPAYSVKDVAYQRCVDIQATVVEIMIANLELISGNSVYVTVNLAFLPTTTCPKGFLFHTLCAVTYHTFLAQDESIQISSPLLAHFLTSVCWGTELRLMHTPIFFCYVFFFATSCIRTVSMVWVRMKHFNHDFQPITELLQQQNQSESDHFFSSFLFFFFLFHCYYWFILILFYY